MTLTTIPDHLRLANRPTPVQWLKRYSQERGVEVWMKRDDLTGLLLSGNKVRKLEFIFARARRENASGVVSCGGVNSNHCRATAVVATRLGLTCDLYLRTNDGEPPASWQGNTLLDAICGARIHWIDPDQYRRRDELLAQFVERRKREGERVLAIPEGGSDPTGALGYVCAVRELVEDSGPGIPRFDYLVHAMGSGGTTAGLSAGRRVFHAEWTLVGVPVCDDAAYFRRKVQEIRQGMADFGLPPWGGDDELAILEGYQGRGYGLTTPEELTRVRDFCRSEGILLDPCYTGKAFGALEREIEKGFFPAGSKILFLHTGGVFGNFSYSGEWGEVL